MKKYTYTDAKKAIQAICRAATDGTFDTREKFLDMLNRNPHIAAQGYNAHGKIFFWNDAAADLFGHSEAAAVNQDLYELILPDELRRLAQDMLRVAARTGKFPDPGACDLEQYDGDRVTVFSGHLVFTWEGTRSEFYCINLPLTSDPSTSGFSQ